MVRALLVVAAVLFSGVSHTAYAQEEDEPGDTDEFEFEEPEEPAKKPEEKKPEEKKPADSKAPTTAPPANPPPAEPEESDEIEFEDETEDEEDPKAEPKKDFLEDPKEDDRTDAELLAPGTDDAEIYRAQEKEVDGMPPDEEVMSWEAYLEKYPNSIYRKRIEERVDVLVEGQFRMRIDGPQSGNGNADSQELAFVVPMQMTNVNPRTKAQLGIGFGFPTFLAMTADFEYAFLRNLSAHAGINGRYTGWSFDVGARYAFVKSTRLKFIATLVADIGINFNQRVQTRQEGINADANRIFFQARPQLAFGKLIGPAQILLTIGTDVGSRPNTGPAVIGGAHVGVRIAPPVGVYVETDFYVRNLGREAGPFTFDVLSFGFKFYPMAKRADDPLEIGMAGHIPYATQYLQPYVGAVQVQGVYYPGFGR